MQNIKKVIYETTHRSFLTPSVFAYGKYTSLIRELSRLYRD